MCYFHREGHFPFSNFHFPPRDDKAGIQPASSLIIYDCAGRSKRAGSGWRGATFVMPSAERLSSPCWEVVQLAVQQILDLLILVRVQASQPFFETTRVA